MKILFLGQVSYLLGGTKQGPRGEAGIYSQKRWTETLAICA